MATNGEKTEDQTQRLFKDGQYVRPVSAFRSWISSAPGAEFPPEKDRYVLYINPMCPFAARANLVRSLKGLDSIIQRVVLDWEFFPEGWSFTGRDGTDTADPLYGFTRLSQIYFKAEAGYTGRYTVPVLWDKKKETIVSNESAEIIRMFYTEFDSLLPEELRTANSPGGGFLPKHLLKEIEEINDWIAPEINNGVYKTGFATNQEAYETHVKILFKALDRLEAHLASDKYPGPFIFGENFTDADVKLYTSIARFDVAYYSLFLCNLKMIRYDYPAIQKWFESVWWDEGILGKAAHETTHFNAIKKGYAHLAKRTLVPLGPEVVVPPKK